MRPSRKRPTPTMRGTQYSGTRSILTSTMHKPTRMTIPPAIISPRPDLLATVSTSRSVRAATLARPRRVVNRLEKVCCCYMKMSWGNCYVKVSWGAPFVEVSFPHGDLHDEPEGVAPGRPGQGRRRRTHHQSARSHESAAERPAISAVEAPLRDGRGRRLAPPEPWPAVVPPRARGAPHQGDDPHDHRLCGLQRCPSHRETARGRATPAQP